MIDISAQKDDFYIDYRNYFLKSGLRMNAVVALCHFCELHGPSVLFCTQAFHCMNHNPEEVLRGVEASLSACGNFNHGSLFGPKERLTENLVGEGEENHSTPKKAEPRQSTCIACTSMQPGEPGLFSLDRESHISYISRQFPEDQELYSIVRHACVRSLSCEVCPGREGPIMFGDEASGYVFSYTFFLKDSQSRGFQRWYSVICVMMDKVYLVNSWPFLITHFKAIIEELQLKADVTFKSEKAQNPLADQRLHMSSTFFLLNPNQFIRTRGGNQNYRSLHDLVQDKNIFQYLHKYFSWILKASGQRYSEQFVVGPPEEYFDANEEEESSIKADGLGLSFSSLRQLSKFISAEKLKQVAFHVVIGDQLIVRGSNSNTVASFLNVFRELIPAGCYRGALYSKEYQDSWRVNFIGIDYSCEIPAHVLSSNLYVLVDIKSNQNASSSSNNDAITENQDFTDVDFTVQGSSCFTCPTYLLDVLKALVDEDFTDSVFANILSALKDEWMNKVKVMFKFSKCGSRTSEEKVKLLKVLNAKPEDEILLKFWMTALSRPYRAHLLSCATQKSVQRTGIKGEISSEDLFFTVP